MSDAAAFYDEVRRRLDRVGETAGVVAATVVDQLDRPVRLQQTVDQASESLDGLVFVIDGRAVSQVDKLPAADEIRVHEQFGGSYRPVPVREEAADLARRGMAEAARVVGVPLDYGRVDMLRLADGRLAVSELELTEPGLYLDVLPGNAAPFADLIEARLR